MPLPADYIDLNRRFAARDPKVAAEDLAQQSYDLDRWLTRGSSLTWSELLQKKGVTVVLGEPGSGRTWEFQAQQSRLQASGKTAFYVQLQHLVEHSVEDWLESDHERSFAKWREGTGEAIFFLDAVDEAKLRGVKDFEAALMHFRKSVGARNLSRASVLISCRVHQWDHPADCERVQRQLGLSHSGDGPGDQTKRQAKSNSRDNGAAIRVYVIQPLDRDRVAAYARHKKATDVDAFLTGLDQHHAWEFAGRPYDVDFLLGYWRRHGRLDHLSAMLEDLVSYQLIEAKKDQADKQRLSPGRARDGAEALAAASVLCKRLDFFPPAPLPPPNETALSASACLPSDWSAPEIDALLDRPLFTAPSFGHIRFQHRRTAEFLAACWLRRAMKECSNAELHHLLFARVGNRLVIRESRAPLAVWLACLSDEPWALEIRRTLLHASPHAFFRFGDPSQLPGEYKQRIVNAFVARYQGRDATRTQLDDGTLSRLGDPALATTLNRHLLADDIAPGVKIELLQVATKGRVAGCVPAALELFKADTRRADLPNYALYLIQDCADREQKKHLAALTDSMPSICERISGTLVAILYPEIIGVEGLELLVRRVWLNTSDTNMLVWKLNEHFGKLTENQHLTELINLLLRLTGLEDVDEALQGRENCMWLSPCLLPLINRMLDRSALSNSDRLSLGHAIYRVASLKNSEFWFDTFIGEKLDFQTLTLNHPSVRRYAFEFGMEAERKSAKPDPDLWWRGEKVFLHDLELDFSRHDMCWLLDSIKSLSDAEDKKVVFYFACRMWLKLGSSREVLREIQQVAKAHHEFEEILKSYRKNSRLFEIRQLWRRQRQRGFLNGRWWLLRKRECKAEWNKIQNQFWLHRHIAPISEGRRPDVVHTLVRQATINDRGIVKFDWDELEKKYGKLCKWLGRRIRVAAQMGCISAFEKCHPEPGDKRYAADVGLIGLELMVSRGLIHFEKLAHAEAGKMASYAIHRDDDGFPWWLDELITLHGFAVTEAFQGYLKAEWEMAHDSNGYPRIIARLGNAEEIRVYGAARLLSSWLLTKDPLNPQVLRHTTNCLIKHVLIPHKSWAELSAARIVGYEPNSTEHLIWLSIWIQADAGMAMNYIDSIIETPEEADPRSNMMINLCAGFYGHMLSFPLLPDQSFREPCYAKRFITLVYRYVSPKDDIHRTGGYSPVARDEAQSFRGNLITPLTEHPSPDADIALKELSEAPELLDMRDFVLEMMDRRAERMADQQAWKEKDFRGFADQFEIVPKVLEDLFHLVCRRLEGIKHDVEDAEESIRDELKAERQEKGLQSFLIKKLRDRQNGRYTAPKEAEIDGGERPDIQIHNPVVDGHVQIELKLADMKNRSLNSLLKDLEGQLLGQYLRDRRSTHGIFVVGFSGQGVRQTWQDPETSLPLTFAEVIGALQERAAQLSTETEGVKQLAVYGIDFRPRK